MHPHEQEANLEFALAVLLPEEQVRRDIQATIRNKTPFDPQNIGHLEALARRYNVRRDTVRERLKRMGLSC